MVIIMMWMMIIVMMMMVSIMRMISAVRAPCIGLESITFIFKPAASVSVHCMSKETFCSVYLHPPCSIPYL